MKGQTTTTTTTTTSATANAVRTSCSFVLKDADDNDELKQRAQHHPHELMHLASQNYSSIEIENSPLDNRKQQQHHHHHARQKFSSLDNPNHDDDQTSSALNKTNAIDKCQARPKPSTSIGQQQANQDSAQQAASLQSQQGNNNNNNKPSSQQQASSNYAVSQ